LTIDNARETSMPNLAHQDNDDVAAYKRAGWWGDRTIGDVIKTWAASQPLDLAYVGDDARLTWHEYDARATKLATAFVEAGIPRGARLAILVPDTPAVHVAFVAAERAGVTAVGIGARAGLAEIRHLVSKTGATALVTLEAHRGRDAASLFSEIFDGSAPATHFTIDPDASGDPSVAGTTRPVQDVRLDDRAFGPDDLFMINSTSGTTGLPKCVLHNQNRWFYFHQLAVAAAHLRRDDIFLGAVPAPFGFGLWTQHFTPNLLGATTFVAERFDPQRAIELIERERITVLTCVSTQFLMMLNTPGIEDRDLSSLRCMFTGGEAVPYERAAQFEEVTGARVLQFYGSNETGTLSGTTMDDDREHRLRTAGRIVPEMNVRLLDDDGNDVDAPGVAGHPVCKGPATSFGYLDDDAANAELFTADGWMRIGDLVEIDAEGYLRVVGRTSDIIIRGGKNISAPAVEAEVTSHPAVAVAAAVSMPDPTFGERVCLYAELVDGASLTLQDVTAHLHDRGVSPEWYPERLVVVESLPRASGGKIAKAQLRDDIRRRLERESG
jgi:acyl-CoA synthetase